MSRTFGGRSFVVAFYAVIVALTGVLGAVLGAFGPDDLTSVALLGLVELPPTPLGLAVYGVVTVGLALGIPLALVAYVSRWDDAEPGGDDARSGENAEDGENAGGGGNT